MKDSSLTVARWLPEEGNMIRVDHFTGALLLADDEANQLRALLNIQLQGVEPMSEEEAQRLMNEHNQMFANFLADFVAPK
jgi:hypothetical protein